MAQVGIYVRRVGDGDQFVGDVRQALRTRLLVAAPGGAPRIADYAGRGPLGAWVRVAAVRVAIDLRRSQGQEPLPASGEHDASPADDPELALLKARHSAAYADALRAAMASLSAKERNLMRMHFVDGLSIDRIGVAYQVHRATAARWIEALRERLLAETYRQLGELLRPNPRSSRARRTSPS